MPTMPNLIGIEVSAMQAVLQAAGVLNPNSIGYFDTWPITIKWTAPGAVVSILTADLTTITADSVIPVDENALSTGPGIIVNQSIGSGSVVAQNVALQLTAVDYPIAVAYP